MIVVPRKRKVSYKGSRGIPPASHYLKPEGSSFIADAPEVPKQILKKEKVATDIAVLKYALTLGVKPEQPYLYEDLPPWAEEIKERKKTGKTKILSFSNQKLGGEIASTAMPADLYYTKEGKIACSCPGASPICRLFCYAKGGRERFRTTKAARLANIYLLEENPDLYAKRLDEEIKKAKKKGLKIVRLNVSGDFSSEKMIKAIAKVAKENPDITFTAYTKAWRVPKLRKAIEKMLMPLDNVVILASTDFTTGPPPDGWPEAGIFVSHKKVKATCPAVMSKGVTCSQCRLCYTKSRLEKTGGVVFLMHGPLWESFKSQVLNKKKKVKRKKRATGRPKRKSKSRKRGGKRGKK